MKQEGDKFTNNIDTLDETRIEETKGWLNEHGQPNFEYLQSLANNGGQEAIEKLKSIAEDLSVNFSPNTPAEEMVGKIMSVVRQNEDAGPDFTT